MDSNTSNFQNGNAIPPLNQAPKPSRVHPVVVACGVFVVILVVLYFAFPDIFSHVPTSPQPGQPTTQTQKNVIQLPEQSVISKFPKGLPIESGAQSISSYVVVDSNKVSTTFQYVSVKTVDQL